MRLVMYGAERRPAAIVDGWVVDLAAFGFDRYCCPACGITPLIEGGPGLMAELSDAVERGVSGVMDTPEGHRYRIDDVRLRPACPGRSSRFIMTGANNVTHVADYYRRHGSTATDEEFAQQLRHAGIMGFWKFPHNAAEPGGTIVHPGGDQYLDYEAEVAVVIGKEAKGVAPDDAADYIWGYTVVNDLGIRYQNETTPYNLGVTKNFDGALSAGPAIVTGQTVDVGSVTFETFVNGELRQRGNTKEMLFPFAELISHYSSITTLHPGDVISGGTCSGTAADSSETIDGVVDRRRFLKPGDAVEVHSPEVGVLRNEIVAPDAP